VWWAWLDLNQRPHPYQLNAGNRCADRPLRRSRSTVRAQGIGSIGVQVCVLSGYADRAAIGACWYSSPCASALHLREIYGPDEGLSWPPTRCRVSPAASIPTTRTLASLLRSDGAGMSCGRGLGVRRRPTRRTSSHPRMHGRAGAQRRAGRPPPGRWTPGGLCCGASCWKPRRHPSPRIVLPSRRLAIGQE
jgi:hypothetical protein